MIKRIIGFILFFLVSTLTYAAPHYRTFDYKQEVIQPEYVPQAPAKPRACLLGPCPRNLRSAFILTVGGGGGITGPIGKSTTFPIIDTVTDEFFIYNPSDSSPVAPVFYGFAGMEFPVAFNFDLQIGVSYYNAGFFKAQGTLTQGADIPSEDFFDYSYNLRSQQALVEAKIIYLSQFGNPYFLIGAGGAVNTSQDFEVDEEDFVTFTRIYDDTDHTAFSYMVGFGIDWDLDIGTRFGVGYRFTDLGKFTLGEATIDGVPVGGTLTENHVYVNELLIHFSLVV